ncbi:hypothetical protein CHARACLAT_025935 [Characodon lateralis]|uniref:Uncharacterized protein n=1 Tax=Characodon lateralis TaxID=208331 RepID=A0ABU7DJX1_9TELE|nr:hypothetical protein [Characodon lateralis]
MIKFRKVVETQDKTIANLALTQTDPQGPAVSMARSQNRSLGRNSDKSSSGIKWPQQDGRAIAHARDQNELRKTTVAQAVCWMKTTSSSYSSSAAMVRSGSNQHELLHKLQRGEIKILTKRRPLLQKENRIFILVW